MYTIIVFALALLSPMPFISPFDYGVQDATAQSPFGPFGSDQNLPTDAITQNTSTIDIVTSVTDLSASITSPVVSGISTSVFTWYCICQVLIRSKWTKWRLGGSILYAIIEWRDKWHRRK